VVQNLSKDIFAATPIDVRQQFIEGLNRAVELNKAQNWAELYDLSGLHGVISREQYVKEHRRLQAVLLDFKPNAVYALDKGAKLWVIHGCGEWQYRGETKRRPSSLTARLHGRQWSFEDVGVQMILRKEPDLCTLPQSPTRAW